MDLIEKLYTDGMLIFEPIVIGETNENNGVNENEQAERAKNEKAQDAKGRGKIRRYFNSLLAVLRKR